jgi:hypothetical protein
VSAAVGDFAGARTDEPIEKRIARLEDIEAIQRLKARYAQLHDRGYDGDAVAELFVDDAVWESNSAGVYHGREEIREMVNGVGVRTQGLFASHLMLNPDITVQDDGSSAEGQWYLLMLATMPGVHDQKERDSVVVSANYRDTFVKVDGEWRFKKVEVQFHHVANLDDGWAKRPFRSA